MASGAGKTLPERFSTAVDRLHEAATAEVGSSDFGDDSYREGLDTLLHAVDYEPRLTERGRRMTWNDIVDALACRAVTFRSMAENPGFDRRPIAKPIIITGFPRTGTTALHKLMAVDPQFQGLEKWLLSAPMPRPPRETWASNPYFRREVERLNAQYGATPDLRAAHNMVAEEVDECIWLEGSTFISNRWASGSALTTYFGWWLAQDSRPFYRHLYKTLQLIGLNDPDKRWLLKNPSHVLYFDLLFETFPDALVIQTHRDPAKALPSLCALLMQNSDVRETGDRRLRAHNLAVREIAKYAKGVREAEPVRQVRTRQVMDVVHGDFHRDPMGVVRRIYEFVDLELKPEVEAAMKRRIAAAPELSHGAHLYDVADFGLTEDEVRRRFGDYVDRFDLRPPKNG